MRLQLLLQDSDGLTLAMHATRGGSVAVLKSVMAEVQGVEVGVVKPRCPFFLETRLV